MNLWRKEFRKQVKSSRLRKKRKMMKQSREVEMKDVMLVKDVENLGAGEEVKKMKGVLESCCRQEDLPKYDLSNSHSMQGEASSTSCDVCMDVFSIRDLVCAPSCKHRVCRDCMKIYLRKEIQEDASQVVCPESKCKDVLRPEFCRRFIPEEVFCRWKSELTLASSFGRRKIECPNPDCRQEFMDDSKGYPIRACPKCWNLICMPCGLVEWHAGKDCHTFRMENMYSNYYERRARYNFQHDGKFRFGL
ncbi:uncharacterized protein LOC108221125 [Daucus carota subsp. sativus]|uniref:RBR-type E3 ubiquitin transferase n=2 Tax=Daucus carota subsp. sativus TaxID=79200 RepID=A0A164XAS3_DAUCS|nr:PREDICTED: probable E3 ubiquitin-protein ligase RNF217 [Daucus carota subsp. sativus]